MIDGAGQFELSVHYRTVEKPMQSEPFPTHQA